MGTTFIEQLKAAAVIHGNAGNILPSLIVAQGILESAYGTSELATKAHNYFGIKVGPGWTGEWYSKVSDEWSPEKGTHPQLSAFRKYPNLEACVVDLVNFYQKPRYAAVIGQPDLLQAATAAWRAGYATDPGYPKKLLTVYQQNKLEGMGLHLADKVWAVGAGHGGFGVTPGKRGPDGKFEWIWNNAVVVAAIAHMTTKYKGVKIVRVDDPTGRTDVPLYMRERRVEQAKADAYTSVHHNAMGSKWIAKGLGIETFVMTPISANPQSHALAKAIHPGIVKAMGLLDRGIKGGNFYVLRETDNVAAILTEGGFMDSRTDRAAMDNDSKIRAQGMALADGVAKFLNLAAATPAPVQAAAKWFRVRKTWADEKSQIGAFLTLAEAKRLVDARQTEGYEVYDHTGKMVYEPAQKWFRVRKAWTDEKSQLAAFLVLDQAMEIAAKPEVAAQGYKVYDDGGRVVFEPKVIAKPVIPTNPELDHEKDEVGPIMSDEVHETLQKEWAEAIELEFTDGTNPNKPMTRVQGTVISLRVYKKIMEQLNKQK